MSGFEILIITAKRFLVGGAFTKVKVLFHEKKFKSLLWQKGNVSEKKRRRVVYRRLADHMQYIWDNKSFKSRCDSYIYDLFFIFWVID